MKHEFIGQQDWPTGVVMPAGSQQIAELSVGTLVLIAALWGIRNFFKHGDARLLLCLTAALLASVMETHTMYMLKFFYPQIGQHAFLTGFGRPLPMFLPLTYCAFFGIANYFYINSKIATTFSARSFVLGMGALFIAELVMEVACVNIGVWAYFGDQPFLVKDFPPHVAVIVGCMCVVVGAISRIWFDRVKGIRQCWILLWAPMAMFATFEVCSFPVAFALWSGGGLPASQIGSAITILLSLGLSFVIAKTLATVPNISPNALPAHKKSYT